MLRKGEGTIVDSFNNHCSYLSFLNGVYMGHLAVAQNPVIQVFDDLMNPYCNFPFGLCLKRDGHYVRVDLLPLAEPICPYFIMSVYIATFPSIGPGHIRMYKG